ncbi:MAG: UvrD-helicase domain-containing protein, partial [Muribaculaceae bacterium]|nr:UvrD-helicase domain-containing protein [Muribaculaceae bacterium]
MTTDYDYLSDLNDAQRAAVTYDAGPELVIAGAGSGKTRVLTYKILHLLVDRKIEPWRIMALTFTNKAAAEMRSRIEKMTGTKVASRLWMGTFHSIFRRILNAHVDRIGFKPGFTIYDSADSKALVLSLIQNSEPTTLRRSYY